VPSLWSTFEIASISQIARARFFSFGSLAGPHQISCHFPKLDVEMLGGSTQDVERLICRDPLSLHQNPYGLSDHLATSKSAIEVSLFAFLVFVLASRRKSLACQ
jgi:hypothetical protein